MSFITAARPIASAFILDALNANRLSAVFIEENDREDLTDATIQEYYDPSPEKWRHMITVSRKVLIENGQFRPTKRSWSEGVRRKHGRSKYARFLDYAELNKTQISVTIKHMTACERMLSARQPLALVLEDDAVFNREFAAAAAEALALTPSGWDYIGIGEGCGLRVPWRHAGETIYRMRPPRTNGAEAYFMSERLARSILTHGKPFTWPIDWLEQFVMMRQDLVCYWRDPPLVSQGSEAD